MIPEIDIWRVAKLMLERYGDQAEVESAIRMQELAFSGDSAGAAVWRRIIDAIGQLVNMTPPGPVHCPHARGEDYSAGVSRCISSATTMPPERPAELLNITPSLSMSKVPEIRCERPAGHRNVINLLFG